MGFILKSDHCDLTYSSIAVSGTYTVAVLGIPFTAFSLSNGGFMPLQIIVLILLQSKKADSLISVTDAGIVIVVRFVQNENAASPI